MSGNVYVIFIQFIDRFGLGYEVFEVLNAHGINAIGMEATADKGMMVKFKGCSREGMTKLIDSIMKVKGVTSVNIVEQMPYEQREDQLKTILDLVSDGVIAVNKDGEITHINNVACTTLYTTQEEAVKNRIEDILDDNIPILDTLKTGKSYNFKEIKFKKDKKLFHYLTSGSPIISEKGQIVGAVATIKDYKQVEEIISKVDKRINLTTFNDIVFQSDHMKKLIETAKTVAKGDSSVLLRGESGTGKELFARAIHMESNRAGSTFIAINCAALPESLLESELFGYEEGSFTGATKGGRKGLFEQADAGTLFLDEIGEISPKIQVRLLRVLQEYSIRRVGGTKEIPIDVRIIAATNQNLEEMVVKGTFREDLYYRLNVIPITIPPLRERPEDIPLIAQHLIRKIAFKLNKDNIKLSKNTFQYLLSQPWPGNVRQLENTLERIINILDGNEITLEHFYEWGRVEPKRQLLQQQEDILHFDIPINQDLTNLKEIVEEVEKEVLIKILQQHKSSRKAGRVLGVSNTTVLNKMKYYGIKV